MELSLSTIVCSSLKLALRHHQRLGLMEIARDPVALILHIAIFAFEVDAVSCLTSGYLSCNLVVLAS